MYPATTVYIYFRDSDGDKCVLDSGDDLSIALADAKGPVKLTVESNPPPPPPSRVPPLLESPGRDIKEMVDSIAAVVVDGVR